MPSRSTTPGKIGIPGQETIDYMDLPHVRLNGCQLGPNAASIQRLGSRVRARRRCFGTKKLQVTIKNFKLHSYGNIFATIFLPQSSGYLMKIFGIDTAPRYSPNRVIGAKKWSDGGTCLVSRDMVFGATVPTIYPEKPGIRGPEPVRRRPPRTRNVRGGPTRFRRRPGRFACGLFEAT